MLRLELGNIRGGIEMIIKLIGLLASIVIMVVNKDSNTKIGKINLCIGSLFTVYWILNLSNIWSL